jgi:hypothetical protein
MIKFPLLAAGAVAAAIAGLALATPAQAHPTDEQAALDAVSPACTESPDKLDAEAAKAVELLADSGVHDETTVTMLRHLRESIPDGAPRMDCAQVLGAYIRLRSNG